MRILVCLSIVYCFFFTHAFSQNLVPNPSFEDYLECPEFSSSIVPPIESETTLLHWFRPSGGTSDYFHTCAPTTGAFPISVPVNFAGYQLPRTGNAYAGFYTVIDYTIMLYREYIEAPLNITLEAGHQYHVSYFLNLACDDLNPSFAYDQFGAYFSESYFYDSLLAECIPVTPQVVSPVGYTYTDSLGWDVVSGIFTAAGNENWIIIGNFTPFELLTQEKVVYYPDLDGFVPDFSYYYIDDICVFDLANPPFSTTIVDTSIKCIGDTIVLKSSHFTNSYLWSDGSRLAELSVSAPGTYWVKSIDEGACGYYIDTFRINADIMPVTVDLGNDTFICPGHPIKVEAYDTLYQSYRWNTGEHTSSIEINSAGTYYVTATSVCYVGTDTIVVVTPPAPLAVLPADMVLCNGIPVMLGRQQERIDYRWNTGAAQCCIEVQESGDYSIVATNECGQEATDTVSILYSDCENCLQVPNAFSPNNDGLNDKFKVIANCSMDKYRLNIYSRWGQLVFSTLSADEGWDGTFNGSPVDLGTYFYYIQATPAVKELETINLKGDITLIR